MGRVSGTFFMAVTLILLWLFEFPGAKPPACAFVQASPLPKRDLLVETLSYLQYIEESKEWWCCWLFGVGI